MHIINLSLKCKTATGDGTRIVSMNSDYVVRITAEDCGTFTSASVKKLVIRHDREYQEVDIVEILDVGKPVLQAILPPIPYPDFVDLGVCGKNTDGNIVYASTSARYDCDKSILNGLVASVDSTTLTELDVTVNGEYKATDYGANGFHTITVDVAGSNTEEKYVQLQMPNDDQIIEPTPGYAMSKVRVAKPTTLIPKNIVEGINIGGVVGTHKLKEKIISEDGEYNPVDDDANGFSKVIVTVARSSREKTLRVGHKFTYTYNARVEIELGTPGIIQYADTGTYAEFTAVALGNCMLTIRDYDADDNLVNTVYYDVSVTTDGDLTVPIEVSSAYDMNNYLLRGAVGGVLKYVGEPTEEFKQDSLYLIEGV